MEKYIHLSTIITFFHHHPAWGSVLAFMAAFIETIAVLGSFVPGSVTMTAVGALAGSAVIPLTSALIWATAGAFTGDILSYWLGYRYKHWVLNRWPLKNYPQWISKCEAFFDEHGGKSVIIGRFVAPMRSLVPMVAGILNMKPGPIIPVIFVSAVLWTIVYLIPGVLLGALSVETPPGVATKLIVIVLTALVGLWLLSWLAKLIYSKVKNTLSRQFQRWWSRQSHKNTLIWRLFAPADDPDDFTPLLLTLAALVTLTLFALVTYQVVTQTGLSMLNHSLNSLARSLHFPWLTHFMLGASYIGGAKKVLAVVVAAVAIWLGVTRQWYALVVWLVLAIMTPLAIIILKNGVASPRPEGLAEQKNSFSYPSGHTTFVFTIPCFLMVLIGQTLKQHRWLPYTIAAILAPLVGLSRLYLTAHWFSDVIGGLLLGLTILCVISAIYFRGPRTELRVVPFTITIAGIWLITAVIYMAFDYRQAYASYQLQWPQGVVTYEDWWHGQAAQPIASGNRSLLHNNRLPLYRTSRLGQIIGALNVHWLGEIETLRSHLKHEQWKALPEADDWRHLIQRYMWHRKNPQLPVLSQLYHNRRPALLMYHSDTQQHTALILRLWPSDYQIQGQKDKLWIGSVELYNPPYHYWLKGKDKQGLHEPTAILQKDLKAYSTKLIKHNVLPEVNLEWQGRVLYVQQ